MVVMVRVPALVVLTMMIMVVIVPVIVPVLMRMPVLLAVGTCVLVRGGLISVLLDGKFRR